MSEQLAPEILSMLRVVLADNSSAFQRIASLRAKGILEGPISPSEPFLSKEERHLVAWHREEIGQLLFEGCMLTLQGPVETTKTILNRPPVEEAHWRERCTRALDANTARWPAERDALRDVPPGQGLGSGAARLSLALLPTDDARYALAGLLRVEGDFGASREVARSLIEGSLSSGHRACAFTVLGTCAHLNGDHGTALDAYRMAAKTDRRVSTAFLNWFVQAVHTGDTGEALAASEQLRENRDAVRPFLDSHIAILKAYPACRLRERAPKAFAAIQRSPLDDTARRILDVLE